MNIFRLVKKSIISRKCAKTLFSKPINYCSPGQIFARHLSGIYESPFNDCSIPTGITFAQHILEDFLLYDDLPAIVSIILCNQMMYDA